MLKKKRKTPMPRRRMAIGARAQSEELVKRTPMPTRTTKMKSSMRSLERKLRRLRLWDLV
jgi:hypothetical protein